MLTHAKCYVHNPHWMWCALSRSSFNQLNEGRQFSLQYNQMCQRDKYFFFLRRRRRRIVWIKWYGQTLTSWASIHQRQTHTHTGKSIAQKTTLAMGVASLHRNKIPFLNIWICSRWKWGTEQKKERYRKRESCERRRPENFHTLTIWWFFWLKLVTSLDVFPFYIFVLFCSSYLGQQTPSFCLSVCPYSRHATTHSRLLAHFQIKMIVRRHTHVTTDIQHSRQHKFEWPFHHHYFPLAARRHFP